MHCGYDLIDCFGIQQAYQIKAEAVNMIFICPVVDRIHNIFPYHRTLGSRIVSASGTVRITAVRVRSGEIFRHQLVERECIRIVYMIIYHIHNDIDVTVMQRLYHLLHLFHPNFTVIRICRVGTLWHIVIHRIIPPVILRRIQLCLINGTVIIGRQQVNMRNSQIFQIIESCCLSAGTYRSFFRQS